MQPNVKSKIIDHGPVDVLYIQAIFYNFFYGS